MGLRRETIFSSGFLRLLVTDLSFLSPFSIQFSYYANVPTASFVILVWLITPTQPREFVIGRKIQTTQYTTVSWNNVSLDRPCRLGTFLFTVLKFCTFINVVPDVKKVGLGYETTFGQCGIKQKGNMIFFNFLVYFLIFAFQTKFSNKMILQLN